MEVWVEYVSQVGFPIVITFYLLFKFEKKLNKNTEVMERLIGVFEEVIKHSRK